MAEAKSRRPFRLAGDGPEFIGDMRLAGAKYENQLYFWGGVLPATEQQFVVVTDDGVDSIHLGQGMTLAGVVAEEACCVDRDQPAPLHGEDEPDYDLVVFDRDGRARAIVRRGRYRDRVALLDGLEFRGADWREGLADVDA